MGVIRVARGETKRMAVLFGCTGQTVRNALREVTEGDLTERIRREALRTGGVEVPRRRMIKKANV